MEDNRDIYMQHEINALRTSHRWATLGIVIVILLALAGLGWAIDHYFGSQGMRIFLIATGIAVIVILVYALSIATAAIYGRMAQSHHDNVLQGLIQFQRADDYGEVARQVAAGMSGAIRTGNQVDAKVLQVANQLSTYRQAQLTDSQRQQPQPPTWAMADTEPAETPAFRHID